MKGYIVLDIETTIRTHLGRKASPFGGDNWIVAAAASIDGGPVGGVYWGRDKVGSRGYLRLLLERDPKFLVGFNIKFDILHLIRHPEDYEAYQAWIARGGQLWDTQLAEYLLDGQRQESHMLSLDEVAPRYGGSLKIDEVKAMWNEGIDTPDIPQQLLMDYLTGRETPDGWDPGDVENTALIFLGQLKAAKKTGQTRSIQLNNGALVATIEMERNGLFVDEVLGREQAALKVEEIQRMKEALQEYLPKDLPFEFNWGSRKQLSALIFGGKVKYRQQVHQVDEEGHPAYAKMDETGYELVQGGYTLLPPGSKGMPDDAYVYFSSGKKKGLPKTKKVKVNDPSRPKIKWEDFYYPFKGYTKPKPEWESKADKGVYSTSADVIEELGGRNIAFLDTLSDLGDMVKDLGTYYLTEEVDEETGEVVKAKGMLTLVHHDGLVHANISMTSTVTARFAHSKPNIGNLPRSDTSEVKQMFISRWGDDGEMQSSDFTSLEVYMQALLSGDKQLIADLQAGMDMHIKRLSAAEGKPYEWVWAKVFEEKNKDWIVKRKHIKVFSFQRAYGAGPPKIARFLKLPVEVVEGFARADEEMYPGVVAYNETVAQFVGQSRVPEQRFAVHPTAKVNLQLGIGKFRTFDGKVYTFREQPAPDFMVKRGKLQGFKPTELKNYPVQGLGGEWMKAAMWLAVRTFYKYRNFGGLALLVNTVHDALYADAHKSVARKSGVVLHAAMLAASDFMEYWFGHKVAVPVPSETTRGPSMYVEEPFDDKEAFDAAADKVRTWMRKEYMEGYVPSFLEN